MTTLPGIPHFQAQRYGHAAISLEGAGGDAIALSGGCPWQFFRAAGAAPARAQHAPAVALPPIFNSRFRGRRRLQGTEREVKLTFGSSGNFFRQIQQGGPFQMFLSADEQFVFRPRRPGPDARPTARSTRGAASSLFAPYGSPLKSTASWPVCKAALADGRIKRFAIANPEHAPYGRARRGGAAPCRAVGRDKAELVFGRERRAGGAVRDAPARRKAASSPIRWRLSPEVAKLGPIR